MSQITDHTLPPAGRAGRAINDSMPAHVAGMMIMGLNYAGKVIKGSRVLIDFFTKNRVKTALRVGSNCWLTKMDGVIVAVVHDEFRGMGLAGCAIVYG